MKNKFTKLMLLAIIFFSTLLFPDKISAIENPLEVPNNSFGIHIHDESDLDDAAVLVNSSGGDWGYVTVVIRKDERNTSRWQQIFDKMRKLHLIPLVRIASIQTNGGWEKLNINEIDGWVTFLNSLNWVVKNRYIVVGNEPNHAKEWGGEINPSEYANFLEAFSSKLKSVSGDYFILPAGFDSSAPTDHKEHMGEEIYLTKMVEAKPNIFEYIDGWTSHSYPNPHFSGSPDATGRGTVRSFEWELLHLDSLGLKKKLPVFITETGWTHEKEDASLISQKLSKTYDLAWKHPQIAAVTPFILNYREPPFDVFSWKKPDGTYYEFYEMVKSLPKVKGEPVQHVSVNVVTVIFPPLFPGEGKMNGGLAYIRNEGQSVWEGDEIIRTKRQGLNVEIEPKILTSEVEPGDGTFATFKVEI